MAADPIIYCLTELTDYDQFERLCHDLMAESGFPDIEPLGGSKDKGRDALHVSRDGKRNTIFAYSVREDWEAKLKEDADKVIKHGHKCTHFAFLCTERITSSERDKAKKLVETKYGWKFRLYHLERLRVLLVKHRHLLGKHPQIFTPSIIRGFTDRFEQKAADHIFINYAIEDEALATWLTRKLTAEGYRVWCQHITLLGEDEYPVDVDDAIRTRTYAMLALCSRASLLDQDVMYQRATASSLASERGQETLILLGVEDLDPRQLDSRTRQLTPIPFYRSWAEGLVLLLKKLQALDCPRPLNDGREIAASSFFGEDVLGGPEPIYSNCLEVEQVPAIIHRFETRQLLTDEQLDELGIGWAFRAATEKTFLALHRPPEDMAAALGLKPAGGASWRHLHEVDGIRSADLASELIRKSLLVKCRERGLEVCPTTGLRYVPAGLFEGDRLNYVQADGKKSWMNATGQRKYWSPSVPEDYYRYYLAPTFWVRRDLGGDFRVLVKIRVRLSDLAGQSLPSKKVPSRRKHLCNDWWNDDWLNRILALCQHLAEGTSQISVGGPDEEKLIVSATPLQWMVPVGINEKALGESSFDRIEMPDDFDDDADDEDSQQSKVVNA